MKTSCLCDWLTHACFIHSSLYVIAANMNVVTFLCVSEHTMHTRSLRIRVICFTAHSFFAVIHFFYYLFAIIIFNFFQCNVTILFDKHVRRPWPDKLSWCRFFLFWEFRTCGFRFQYVTVSLTERKINFFKLIFQRAIVHNIHMCCVCTCWKDLSRSYMFLLFYCLSLLNCCWWHL